MPLRIALETTLEVLSRFLNFFQKLLPFKGPSGILPMVILFVGELLFNSPCICLKFLNDSLDKIQQNHSVCYSSRLNFILDVQEKKKYKTILQNIFGDFLRKKVQSPETKFSKNNGFSKKINVLLITEEFLYVFFHGNSAWNLEKSMENLSMVSVKYFP